MHFVATQIGRKCLCCARSWRCSSSNGRFRESLVNSQFEHIFYHPGQQSFQKGRGLFQTWVRVHFYQPRVKVFVENEVIAEQFKAKSAFVRVYCLSDSTERLEDTFVHLGDQIFVDTEVFVCIVVVYVVLKLGITQLVSILKIAIIGGILLHSVIGQVNKGIVNVFEVDGVLAG